MTHRVTTTPLTRWMRLSIWFGYWRFRVGQWWPVVVLWLIAQGLTGRPRHRRQTLEMQILTYEHGRKPL